MTGVALVSMTPLDVGGIARHVLQLVDELDDMFSFTVIAPVGPPFAQQLEDLDPSVPVVDIDPAPKYDVLAIPRIRFHLREANPALVHTHDARSRLFAHPAAALQGLPTIHTAHTPPLAHGYGLLRTLVYGGVQFAYNRTLTDRIVFVSRNVERLHAEPGIVPPDRSTTIHNGLDLERFESLRDRREELSHRLRDRIGVDEDTLVFGAVGRLDPEKAIGSLVEAVARLAETEVGIDDIHVVVVGDGRRREPLERAVAAEGLGATFTFLGHLDRQDAYEVLAAFDIYVLPSLYESLSYAALEAIALGLPCIATDVGGNREIVEEGTNGLLVPPQAPDRLAEAISRLASDPQMRRRFGQASRKRAQRFSATDMARQLAEEYRALLEAQAAERP